MWAKKLLVFIWLIPFLGNCQLIIPKKDYVPEVRQARYSFAISLITGANSEAVSFGIYRQSNDRDHEVIFLTKESFLRQASGLEESKANPDKKDYFKENDIDPHVLEQLWRLKHDEYPWHPGNETGWGTKSGVPSERQFQMLAEFGINSMVDYVVGEKVWFFLKKVSNPVWQAEYQMRK